MSHRVRAPVPVHLLEDMQTLREHRQQQHLSQSQPQPQPHSQSHTHALVNPIARSPEQIVSDVVTALAVLEPAVRVHKVGAIAELTALFSQLKAMLNDRNVQLDPELEVEATDLQKKMGYLIQAVEANVFKGAIKGPREFAEESRIRDLKEKLTLKWELEDKKAQKGKRKSGSSSSSKKKNQSLSADKPQVKHKGFGSKSNRSSSQTSDDYLKQVALRTAKRRRSMGASKTNEEENEQEEEEDEDQSGYVTPKRSKSSTKKHVWPAANLSPESRVAGAGAATAPAAAAAAVRSMLDVRGGSRPQRKRALEPVLRNLPNDLSSQQLTQPMTDEDLEDAPIFKSLKARKAEKQAAAAAAAAASAGSEAEEDAPIVLSKRSNMLAPGFMASRANGLMMHTPAAASFASLASALNGGGDEPLPVPNQALLVTKTKNKTSRLITPQARAAAAATASSSSSSSSNVPAGGGSAAAAAEVRRKLQAMRAATSPAAAVARSQSAVVTPKPAAAAANSSRTFAASQMVMDELEDPFAFDL